jgi:hypothetical protein
MWPAREETHPADAEDDAAPAASGRGECVSESPSIDDGEAGAAGQQAQSPEQEAAGEDGPGRGCRTETGELADTHALRGSVTCGLASSSGFAAAIPCAFEEHCAFEEKHRLLRKWRVCRWWGRVRRQARDASALRKAYSGRISLRVALQLAAWRSRARLKRERVAAAALGSIRLHWRAQRFWRVTQAMLQLRRLILQATGMTARSGSSGAPPGPDGAVGITSSVARTLTVRRGDSGSAQAASGAVLAAAVSSSAQVTLGAASAADGWSSLSQQLSQASLQLRAARERWARVAQDWREAAADGRRVKRVALRLQLAVFLWRAWERQARPGTLVQDCTLRQDGTLGQEDFYRGEERCGAAARIETAKHEILYREKKKHKSAACIGTRQHEGLYRGDGRHGTSARTCLSDLYWGEGRHGAPAGVLGHGDGPDCLPYFRVEVRLRLRPTLDAAAAGLAIQRHARGWLARRVHVIPRLCLPGRQHAGALTRMLFLAHRTYPLPQPRAAPVVHHLFVYEPESGLALGVRVWRARHARPFMTVEWHCLLLRLRATCAAVDSPPTAPHSRHPPAVVLYDTEGGNAGQPDPLACLCVMLREAWAEALHRLRASNGQSLVVLPYRSLPAVACSILDVHGGRGRRREKRRARGGGKCAPRADVDVSLLASPEDAPPPDCFSPWTAQTTARRPLGLSASAELHVPPRIVTSSSLLGSPSATSFFPTIPSIPSSSTYRPARHRNSLATQLPPLRTAPTAVSPSRRTKGADFPSGRLYAAGGWLQGPS